MASIPGLQLTIASEVMKRWLSDRLSFWSILSEKRLLWFFHSSFPVDGNLQIEPKDGRALMRIRKGRLMLAHPMLVLAG